MGVNRRDFLKLTGWSAAAGALAQAGFQLLRPGEALAGQYEGDPEVASRRWAMVIDMEKFWKKPQLLDAAVKACHLNHNVPHVVDEHKHTDHKHEIKWIWSDSYPHVFPMQVHKQMARLQHLPFVVMCNQCANPPCVRVCPTQATFQREDGVVMMDFHRCIGCRFCMAGCPYGSRSFNWQDPRKFLDMKKLPANNFPTRMKGVVEKCNGCAERLAEKKPPYCVEASGGAMVYGDLNKPDSAVRKLLDKRYSIRRKPSLGTEPHVFYLV
jgi:molybdopterin-containing oxidoreductase family iron-sulfur binding subunit